MDGQMILYGIYSRDVQNSNRIPHLKYIYFLKCTVILSNLFFKQNKPIKNNYIKWLHT